MDMLQPKDLGLTDQNGKARSFIISKFPAVAGREIMAKYPISNMPKLGDYEVSQETMFKLMNYVAVNNNGTPLRLSTQALIDNHAGDWETLVNLERAMLAYNFRFFENGNGLTSLAELTAKVARKISRIWTDLSAQSSPKDSRPSTNSGRFTP